MGGATRKRDTRSPLTSSSPELRRRRDEKIYRHHSMKKPRDGGDGFESPYSKHSTHQIRHPHHKASSSSRPRESRPLRNYSMKTRRSPSVRHYRHCKCRHCETPPHHKETSSSSGRSIKTRSSTPEFHHSRRHTTSGGRHHRRSAERCHSSKRSYLKSYASMKRSPPSRNKSLKDEHSRHSKIYDFQKRRVVKKPSSKNSSASNSSPVIIYDSRHYSRDTKNKLYHRKPTKRHRSWSSASNDSRHFITHSPNRHSSQIKKEPTVSKRAISRDSHNSLHRACGEPVTKSRRKHKEEKNDVESLEEFQSQKSCSLKDMAINFLKKSERYMQEYNLEKALNCINLALEVHKEEDELLSMLYSRRGSIYRLIDTPRCSLQGFLDFERAYIIHKDNTEARENMSKHFFMSANKFYRKKDYKKALSYCKHSIDLNENNEDASLMLTLIEDKLLDEDLKEHTSPIDVEESSKPSPCKTYSPEKLSAVKHEQHEAVCTEVKRLNDLIRVALKSNNYEEALKYCNLALRLFNSEIYDDSLYCDLLIMKQQLLDSIE